MRLINLIVLHCSASPNGVYVSPQQVDAWHAAPPHNFHRDPAAVAAFNSALPHIGYHWLITADGRRWPGRSSEEIGAHVYGHNAHSIGICMSGTDRYYMTQWQSLAELIGILAFNWQTGRLEKSDRIGYPLRPALAIAQLAKMGIAIKGHRDLSPDINGDGKITSNEWLKTCPGFDVADWLAHEMTPRAESIFDRHPSIASNTGAERLRNAA